MARNVAEKNIDNLYATDLLVNQEQLIMEIQPFLADARVKCETNVIEKSKQWITGGFNKFMSIF